VLVIPAIYIALRGGRKHNRDAGAGHNAGGGGRLSGQSIAVSSLDRGNDSAAFFPPKGALTGRI
jgi:hypothetical protein